jgi:membrane-associated phospholipid phosphatase
MKTFFQQNAVFIVLSLILLVVLGLALIYVPTDELHLFLCDRHTHARDIFYRYYTHVAEWLPYVVCVLLLLFGRVGVGVMASTAMLLSTLFTQIVKHIVVAPRPLTWFAEHFPDIQLPVVEGVKMNLWYSFPSGHTTSFFALAFVLSIVSTNYLSAQRSNSKTVCQSNGLSAIAVQVLLFALATLGAYSRIYLSQHFALDIFGGIVSGLTAGIISYAVFYRFEDKKWYNYRVFAKK